MDIYDFSIQRVCPFGLGEVLIALKIEIHSRALILSMGVCERGR